MSCEFVFIPTDKYYKEHNVRITCNIAFELCFIGYGLAAPIECVTIEIDAFTWLFFVLILWQKIVACYKSTKPSLFLVLIILSRPYNNAKNVMFRFAIQLIWTLLKNTGHCKLCLVQCQDEHVHVRPVVTKHDWQLSFLPHAVSWIQYQVNNSLTNQFNIALKFCYLFYNKMKLKKRD